MKKECILIAGMIMGLILPSSAQHYYVTGQSFDNNNSRQSSVGDVDGDGDLDVLVANSSSIESNVLWENNGEGNFSDGGHFNSGLSFSIPMGDLNGNGNLDFFVANLSSGNQVFFGDGNGGFTNSGQSLSNAQSVDANLVDIDGDGDLDAVVANFGGANKIWLNDGSGTFSDSGENMGGEDTSYIAVGDLDDDGDLDFFVTNVSAGNEIWLNDGNTHFTKTAESLGSAKSFVVELADVDGDGDLDAFVGNDEGQANKVYLNDGSGSFTDSGQSFGNSDTIGLALADLDQDGDIDAMVGNDSGHSNKVYLNDGTGVFSAYQSLGGAQTKGVSLGDFDGDGDLDVYATNVQQGNRIYLNCLLPRIDAIYADSPSVCIGSTTIVRIDGDINEGSEWRWYEDGEDTFLGTGTELTVAPTITTTYRIESSGSCGPSETTGTVTVMVDPLPTVIAQTSETEVCPLTAVLLTGSGATTYTWDLGVENGNPYIPELTATYTVTGTDLNGCKNTDQITVTVLPFPEVTIEGDVQLCEGESTSLTASGDAVFTWDHGLTNGEVFTPVTTDDYNLTAVANTNGCTVPVDVITVSVNPYPENVVANSTATGIKGGESVVLTGSGATTYEWDNSAIDGEEIVPFGTTTYTVTGYNQFGCGLSDEITINVTKSDQIITFETLLDKTVIDEDFNLMATTSSNLDITYASSDESVVALSGNEAIIMGAGTATITASQLGNANYHAANDVTHTLTINKADQIITFDPLEDKTLGALPTFELVGTASSGLSLSYTSTDENVATVSGSTVTIVGAGSTEIIASQAGDDTYYQAMEVVQILTVNKAEQSITFDTLTAVTFGDADFELTAASDSGLGITYSSSDETVATIAGNIVSIVGAGTTEITASQAGDDTYKAAVDVSHILTVVIPLTVGYSMVDNLLKIYPNPASDKIKIEVSQENWLGEVAIYDLSGSLIQKLASPSQYIQVGELTKGAYLIKINLANTQVITKRFVKR